MIRSYLHPMMFSALFHLLKYLNIDSTWLVIMAPKLLQGVAAAIGDFYLYLLSKSLFGKDTAKWALTCQLISWYMFVCIVRTYSNSIETILFVISLYYFPLPLKQQPSEKNYKIWNNIQISVVLTTFAFVIRPTTCIMWLYLVPLYIVKNVRSVKSLFKFIIVDCFIPFALAFGISIAIDYIYYGQITIVAYNFLYFNVVKNISSFYGTHPFHWFFTQGFPTIAYTTLPIFILSYYQLYKKGDTQRLHLANVAWFTIFFYSLLAHKEFRFIMPILPIVMIYAGHFISSLLNITQSTKKESKSTKDDHPSTSASQSTPTTKPIYITLIGILLLLNIPMIVFFTTFHQRSPIDIMHYINSDISPLYPANGNANVSVHLLMSCHATPFQSYVHNPRVNLKMLECPPPIHQLHDDHQTQTQTQTQSVLYQTEKDIFYADPRKYLTTRYNLTPPKLSKFQKPNDRQTTTTDNNNNKVIIMEIPDYFIINDDLVDQFLNTTAISKYYKQKQTVVITTK
ncbi:putative transmembrane protein [Cavenderia fasciculata]|uniref:Mannosyltransferase n=1 Tax=Cavenderia fasciculata TaxID=261658 RepID=F4PL07_CACFS|nr:putative transmembrane protein [Cavenderia fasciculata]EGG23229.1 putative transmembrane protein [Cavenderia fasciculata]|eukprot:XP_004361080.1 putative transmembrane protein [Cavenderia fasciculata]